MNNQHTLTRHRDIQNWVSDHRGTPAIARVRDTYGSVKSQLRLSFEQRARARTNLAETDDGVTPVSWTAWLAELDRQQLALKVSSDATAFEFVERRAANFARTQH